MKAAIYGTWAGSVLVAVAAFWLGYPWWILLALIPLALTLYASLAKSCDWWGPVLRTFGSRYREVLLTFEGAPDPDETPVVLVLLERYRARGMFLVDHDRAQISPDLIREIVQRGHGVGLALSHVAGKPVWRAAPASIAQTLGELKLEVGKLLPSYVLKYVKVSGAIRPPWLHPVLDRLGLQLMGASASDGGLVCRDVDQTLLRMRKDVGKGGVIAFHHGQRDISGNPVMTEVLEEMLIWLRGQGYTMGE